MKKLRLLTKTTQCVMFLVFVMAVWTTGAAAQDVSYYISGGGGWSMTDDHDFDTGSGAVGVVDTELDDGYGLFGAFGAKYEDFRGELEISWRSAEVESHKLGSTTLPGSVGDAETLAGLVNVYYDIPTNSDVIPYVGAGIGIANVNFDGYTITGVPSVLDDDDTVFAYQFIAGLGYQVSESVVLTVDYRYFGTSDPDITTTLGSNSTSSEYESHSVFFGARYGF